MGVDKQLLPASFEDASGAVGGVHIASDWRADVAMVSVECETAPVETNSQRTQAPKTKEGGAQTEDSSGVGEGSLSHAGFVESAELNSFLLSSTADLEEALQRNLTSNVFDQYDVSWEDEHDQVVCLHSLKHRGALPATAPEAVLESCTAVSWNASGSVIAAAYGPLDRNDWEMSESMLCTWSVMRRQLDPAKADTALQLSCCLVSLAFHPTDPALLAGGAYNGDVMLFRLGAEGGDLVHCKTLLTEYTHQWPVVQLAWTRLPQLGAALASASADGRVLVWTPSNKLAHPVMGFQLSDGDRSAAAQPDGAPQRKAAGGTALGFSPLDPTLFVAGLEAGQMLKCGLHANALRTVEMVCAQRGEVPWTAAAAALLTHVPAATYNRLKLRVEKEAVLSRAKQVGAATVFAAGPGVEQIYHSPASFAYEPHSGPVYAVAFSPFHRNVFLSVSTDSSVRLFNVLQPKPLLVTEPCSGTLFSASWSPSRPSVFAVGASDGHLYIYDLKRNRGKPDVSLKVTTDKTPVYAVAFNPKEPSLVATADGQGFVKIWRLSGALSAMAPREQEAFDKLAGSRGEGRGDEADEEAEEERETEKRGGVDF